MMSLYPELDNRDLAALMTLFVQDAPADAGDGMLYFDEIARRIAAYGHAGRTFLVAQGATADSPHMVGLLGGLSSPTCTPASAAFIHTALTDVRPPVVAAAIDALTALHDTTLRPQIEALTDHADPVVRAAVLRYSGRVAGGDALPRLIDALTDPSAVVRATAIDTLDDTGYAASVPALRHYIDDPDADVRAAARWAVYGDVEG